MADDVVQLVREKMSGLDVFMTDVRQQLTTLDGRLEKLKQQALARPPMGLLSLHGQHAEDSTIGALVARSEQVKNFISGTVRGAAVVPIPGRLVEKAIVVTGTDVKPGTQTMPPALLPAPPLTVADLIPSVPLREGAIQFVRQKSPRAIAGIQANEGDAKLEATLGFETVNVVPETLAVWIPISRQAAQDVAGLQSLIETDLLYAIRQLEEQEILNGAGAKHLTGIVPIATAVTTAATTELDAIAALLASLTTAGVTPTGLVLNPGDWNGMVTVKDSTGSYLLGAPTQAVPQVLWGVSLVLSAAMPQGTALAGDFQRGAMLGYREDANIQISSEHADYFVRNLLAIRAEERVLLAIRQPSAFAKVTLP